jgi:hypothetical protein
MDWMMSGIEKEYYWVVLCKNHLFHNRQNRFSGHKILLAETDAVLPRPRLGGSLRVRCNDCGKSMPTVPLRFSGSNWNRLSPSYHTGCFLF